MYEGNLFVKAVQLRFGNTAYNILSGAKQPNLLLLHSAPYLHTDNCYIYTNKTLHHSRTPLHNTIVIVMIRYLTKASQSYTLVVQHYCSVELPASARGLGGAGNGLHLLHL